MVSTGLGEIGTATHFSGWNEPEQIFGSLDPMNPGWFICYGVFDGSGNLVQANQDLEQVQRLAVDRGLTEFARVSFESYRGDWVRL